MLKYYVRGSKWFRQLLLDMMASGRHTLNVFNNK